MRDNAWLKKQLDFLLKTYFADTAITNPIEIRFGREAKYRFGSIRLLKPKPHRPHLRGEPWLLGGGMIKRWKPNTPQKSIVTITSMFANESIPAEIVDYTIAHELCHYAHGFSSANKRLFKYPHHGGVVNKELKDRGAGKLTAAYKKWIKEYRKTILAGT